jgi:hypothetical protein
MDRTIPDLTEYIQAHRVAYGPDHSGPEVGCAPRPSQALPDRRSRSLEAGGDIAFGHAAPGSRGSKLIPRLRK